jgi:cell division protein FtsN
MTHKHYSLRPGQQGGTLLGLIIGLVIGLAVALGVAVYVNKVPTPFNSKSPNRSVEQQTQDQNKEKEWDPNSALAGKNAGKNKAERAESTDISKSNPILSPPAVVGGSTNETASPAGSVDGFFYFVQAGAYKSAEEAEAQHARLGLLGFEAKVTTREQSGRVIHRVRIGPIESKDEAELVQKKLGAAKIDTALLRTAR